MKKVKDKWVLGKGYPDFTPETDNDRRICEAIQGIESKFDEIASQNKGRLESLSDEGFCPKSLNEKRPCADRTANLFDLMAKTVDWAFSVEFALVTLEECLKQTPDSEELAAYMRDYLNEIREQLVFCRLMGKTYHNFCERYTDMIFGKKSV